MRPILIVSLIAITGYDLSFGNGCARRDDCAPDYRTSGAGYAFAVVTRRVAARARTAHG